MGACRDSGLVGLARRTGCRNGFPGRARGRIRRACGVTFLSENFFFLFFFSSRVRACSRERERERETSASVEFGREKEGGDSEIFNEKTNMPWKRKVQIVVLAFSRHRHDSWELGAVLWFLF